VFCGLCGLFYWISQKTVVDKINPRLLKSEPLQRCQLHDCKAACCLYGVWLDEKEWEDIQAHAGLIEVHMSANFQDTNLWVDGRTDIDKYSRSGRVIHSRVLDDEDHYGGTACVFLRSDYKCALQVAGEAAGLHPWRFKPFYCVLHPLDLDKSGRITLDATLSLQEEPASCLRASEMYVPLLITFEPELRYLLGDAVYESLRSAKD
jgi:hypothetical protein